MCYCAINITASFKNLRGILIYDLFICLKPTTSIMTSPAITKSPDNQKSDKKSPAHSAGTPDQPPSNTDIAAASTSSSTAQQPETFSWLRIFKLADLMMKQGC